MLSFHSSSHLTGLTERLNCKYGLSHSYNPLNIPMQPPAGFESGATCSQCYWQPPRIRTGNMGSLDFPEWELSKASSVSQSSNFQPISILGKQWVQKFQFSQNHVPEWNKPNDSVTWFCIWLYLAHMTCTTLQQFSSSPSHLTNASELHRPVMSCPYDPYSNPRPMTCHCH